jgi:HEAT repeat protein
MDAASGGSRMIGDPEGLLRSALEKIVFFECRVSQLESELAAAHTTAERARGEAARAQQRAVELERDLASERGAREAAERRSGEVDDRVRRLEAERERLLSGLVERARVSGAPGAEGDGGEDGGVDLAGFIAELRAEIETLRADRSAHAPEPSAALRVARPAPHAPETLAALAGRFGADGRVGFTPRDADRMKELLATRADRALYERSMDDLGAPDAGRRLRAVRALEALGSRAAAPLLAAALGREQDAEVKAALLAGLARFKEPFAADLAERELADPRPGVRVAALEALAAVAADAAGRRLSDSLSDPSSVVRRRAALLLGFQSGEGAEEALAVALCDADRGVARAAAAALSGRPSARAQGALARGLEHPDASVRRAAGAALSRVSGEAVDAEASPSARRAASRRISERLAAMDGDQLRAAVLRGATSPPAAAPVVSAAVATPRAPVAAAAAAPVRASVAAPAAPRAPAPASVAAAPRAHARAAAAVAVPEARAAVAVAIADPGGSSDEPAVGDDVDVRVVAEIRAALRGCTPEGLAAALGVPPVRMEAALRTLAAQGTVAQRGTRWFMS